MAFGNSLTGGQGALERPAIKSPNYAPGTTGWSIKRDGSAEFNNITIRGGVTVGGTSLYYSGAPAAGNLVASIAASAGTDPYGNHYEAGFCCYDQSAHTFSQVVTGFLRAGLLTGGAGSAPDTANATKIFDNGNGALFLNGGRSTAPFNDAATMMLAAGEQNQPTGALGPSIVVADDQTNSAVDMLISGSIVQANVIGQAETWRSIGFAGSFYEPGWSDGNIVAGLGSDPLRFRLMPDDTLWLQGAANANTPASTVVCVLPAAYSPAAGTPHGQCLRYSGGVQSPVEVAIPVTGAVIIAGAPANGDVYSFNLRIPLHRVA